VIIHALPAVSSRNHLRLQSHRTIVTHPWGKKSSLSSPYKDGVYNGPFTKLTDTFLDVADPANGFGPEDKLIACTATDNLLVFIDLDESARVLQYSFTTSQWSKQDIVLNNCETGSLFPRDAGYVVGLTVDSVTGLDRLVIIGGSENENNVYYSNDCGINWLCEASTNWPFDPRDYAAIVHTDGIFPKNPLFMGGGIVDIGLPTSGLFQSFDGGINWTRPVCASIDSCNDNLPEPDPVGSCNDLNNPNWQMCYMLPDLPLFPGAMATDWDNMWLWLEPDDDGMLWRLGSDNYATTGWELSSSNWGGFGRKVFIKGTNPGTGCWFSTDYLAEDMWIFPNGQVSSMNNFMTASSAQGPWKDFTGVITAPWAPRASAAITSNFRTTSAFIGSGLSWQMGNIQPSLTPTFGDAWMIDAGVCLLASNGKACAGAVDPDLDAVTCTCPPAFQGDNVCGSCTVGLAYGWPNCQMCPTSNGICNSKGVCDAVKGCNCSNGWTSSGCTDCAIGYFGSSCTACSTCDSTGGSCDGSGTHSGSGQCSCKNGFTGISCSNCKAGYFGSSCTVCNMCDNTGGTCDGSGSRSGSGQCLCNVGFTGITCSLCKNGYFGSSCTACSTCDSKGGICDGSGSRSGSGKCICNEGYTGVDCSQLIPPSSNAAASSQSAGVAAGVSFGVLASLGAALYVYSKYFGGGTKISKAITSLRMSVGGSGSTSGIGERASILRAAPILRVPDSSSSSSSSSPVKPIVLDKAAAAARFSSL
jgi:hypothetical protein